MVLDNDRRQVATVEITQVDVLTFEAVPWELVAAEGEGDETVEGWRQGQRGKPRAPLSITTPNWCALASSWCNAEPFAKTTRNRGT